MSTPGGSVTAPGEGTFTYNSGKVVALVAAAETDYHFVGWSGDVATVFNLVAQNTTITMYANYSITARFEPTVIPGDANGDGLVDAVDITKVERIIVQMDTQTPGADANQDGAMNARDITKVERIIAGLD